MKNNNEHWNLKNFLKLQGTLPAFIFASLFMLSASSSYAFQRYNDGCNDCHGKFTESTTTKVPPSIFPLGDKHEMHNGTSYMNTECDLCHTSGDQKNPYIGSSNGTGNNAGLGCAGCHYELGLRAHHAANGVECHGPEGPPPEENVTPLDSYYGTVDTNVDDPCNAVQAANTGENWTVGDFLGLDNDGDNLYDLADYSCGPLRMVEALPEGSNIRVRWETAGGRTERIQATTVLTNSFSDIGSTVTIPGVGIVTQEVVIVNGAPGSAGFYTVRSNP